MNIKNKIFTIKLISKSANADDSVKNNLNAKKNSLNEKEIINNIVTFFIIFFPLKFILDLNI